MEQAIGAIQVKTASFFGLFQRQLSYVPSPKRKKERKIY